jgi:hypothetical protein
MELRWFFNTLEEKVEEDNLLVKRWIMGLKDRVMIAS